MDATLTELAEKPGQPETTPLENGANVLTIDLPAKARLQSMQSSSRDVSPKKSLSALSSSTTLREDISAVRTEGQITVKDSRKSVKNLPDSRQKNKEGKKIQGWPSRPPFCTLQQDPIEELLEKYTFWSDLTWREKYEYQKEFLRLYLSETRQCFPYVRRLILMIYRISPWRAIVMLVVNIVKSFLPALRLQTRGSFILLLQGGFEKGKLDPKALVKLLIQQLVATIVDRINDEIMVKVTQPLNAHLRQQFEVGILKGYLELHMSEMKDEDIKLRFNEARRVLQEDGINLITKQLTLIRECLSIAAQIATLASLTGRKSWPVLGLTAALPILDKLLAMIPWAGKGMRYYPQVTFEERRCASYLNQISRIAQDINTRPELLIFDSKDWVVERFSKLSELKAKLTELGKLHARPPQLPLLVRYLMPLLQSGSRALLYLIVAFQPDYFGVPLSQLTFLESSMENIFAWIRQLNRAISHNLIHDMFRIRNLFECMNIKTKVAVPENPAPYQSYPYGMKIEVKDLTFTYHAESAPVLKDVNFTIEPGEIVSIVGYNGSGKSTLIRLLTLLEKPTGGNIYINDVDVSEYDPQTLRTNMSILFQDFQKYSCLTAYDNIALGNSKLASDARVVKGASIQSGAHDFIRSFESYYDTEIYKKNDHVDHDPGKVSFVTRFRIDSKTRDAEIPFMLRVLSSRLHLGAEIKGKPLFPGPKPMGKKKTIDVKIPGHIEYGVTERRDQRAISGGQWQRIALARSFMKIKEADLLILDEPSSALDPQAEYEVFKTIMNLRKQKTTIFIVQHQLVCKSNSKSHRFHTVRAASKIMLFDKGKLVEMGKHEELIQIEDGKYAHLFRLQSEGYAQFR